MSHDPMYIASVVATYWFVSISMVYLNKVLMSNEAVSIPAPLFVTWFQCIVTAMICFIAGKCGERAANSHKDYSPVASEEGGPSSGGQTSSFFSQFPRAEYSLGTARRIFPLSIVFVGMITFNNLCLKYVQVSFYNVARSLTIVFNVILSFLFLGVSTSGKTVACLAIVIAGFAMGTQGELDFSLKGTIAGVMSSLFVSLNSIFTKKVLPAVDDNHWRLTFYNNMNACLLFLPLILYFERDIVLGAVDTKLQSGEFWCAMVVAGFFGFAIGIVTVLQIKATSPLSHNISGTAKAAVQSMMAFFIWGNQPTVMGVLGIFVVLGGSLLYTIVKMSENNMMKQQAPPPPPPPKPSEEDQSSSQQEIPKV